MRRPFGQSLRAGRFRLSTANRQRDPEDCGQSASNGGVLAPPPLLLAAVGGLGLIVSDLLRSVLGASARQGAV